MKRNTTPGISDIQLEAYNLIYCKVIQQVIDATPSHDFDHF